MLCPGRDYDRPVVLNTVLDAIQDYSSLPGFKADELVDLAQKVLAGEPVATMGRSRGSSPELYLELRRTGQPINPLPWLAKIGDKVRG